MLLIAEVAAPTAEKSDTEVVGNTNHYAKVVWPARELM